MCILYLSFCFTSDYILFQTNNWQWKFKDNTINIYYEEHEKYNNDSSKNILMVPTISDVSTVEEWRSVARDIVQRVGKFNWRATIVDWPGLGYSDRPKLEYNADVMEKFLVDFINAPDGPINGLGEYGNLCLLGLGCSVRCGYVSKCWIRLFFKVFPRIWSFQQPYPCQCPSIQHGYGGID